MRGPFMLLALCAAGCSWDWDRYQSGPLGAPGNWELTFREECDGPLDETKWGTQYFRNAPFNNYGWARSATSSANVSLEDGVCAIEMHNRPTRDQPYTTGTLDSGGRWQQLYGYFEARMRAARGTGLRTIFELSDPKEWPPVIHLRVDGADPHKGDYVVWYRDGEAKSVTVPVRGVDLALDFHVFGVAWSATQLTFYVDGKRVGEAPSHVPRLLDRPLKFELTGHVGVDKDLPDATTPFPATIAFDWIRAYRARAP